MPLPLLGAMLPAVAPGIGMLQGGALSALGTAAIWPILAQLAREGVGYLGDLRPVRYTDYYPNRELPPEYGGPQRNADAPAAAETQQTAVRTVQMPQTTASNAPAPQQARAVQTAAPVRRSAPTSATNTTAARTQPTVQVRSPAAVTPPPVSAGNPDWHDAGNSMPAQGYANEAMIARSAGASPDTSYADVRRQVAQQAQDYYNAKYDALTKMYGLAAGQPGSTGYNPDAAKAYYNEYGGGIGVFDALNALYGR